MLKNAAIRNLWLGRLVSVSGDSLYEVAVIWYVFELTRNPFYTGLAAAIVMIPKTLNFLFGPIIEELNKKKVLVFAQYFQFLLMLAIPAGMLVGVESVWLVLAILFLISFLENFQGTAEIAVVPEIVPAEQRGAFNSLAASSHLLVDIAMKAAFAGSILFIGIGGIYLYNALTYLAAAFFFGFLKTNRPQQQRPAPQKMDWPSYRKSLKQGFSYFFTGGLLVVCMPFLVANFSFGITSAILPVYAAERGGGAVYGYLILALTIGNLIGTAVVPKLMRYPLGRLMIVLPGCSFLLWTFSVLTGNLWASILFFGLAFVPFGMMSILFITFLQTAIDEDKLARVSSIIDSVLVSSMPLGALLGGIFAPLIGAGNMMLLGGAGLAVIALYFTANKKIRSMPKIGADHLNE
ncbi:MFS transporter [Planococcus sp. APC 3906]|uniref:MFS transporter n=1 Tax=Planococcus sp. APC 3906 TaxID=3035194 RepID=UPI0025B5A005|nr:MFS transporter [Planococcus sp. APC 3906]MDN3451702.1 MFS transporter [Planococcus sp. APC 3906]